ncbi:hypothetical protein ISR94_01910 [Candidatus Microgenomates bacterium]|nr:hypothetical protein [Candidatus Microgenomates bacterium]
MEIPVTIIITNDLPDGVEKQVIKIGTCRGNGASIANSYDIDGNLVTTTVDCDGYGGRNRCWANLIPRGCKEDLKAKVDKHAHKLQKISEYQERAANLETILLEEN